MSFCAYWNTDLRLATDACIVPVRDVDGRSRGQVLQRCDHRLRQRKAVALGLGALGRHEDPGRRTEQREAHAFPRQLFRERGQLLKSNKWSHLSWAYLFVTAISIDVN